ncbi:YbaB/EbfC family nucleoid-associated protein [Mycobacteroides chelonae]|uniref:YbaB/EbfC family nucleoid-associated protein n=1 Tax=Mycobacteroides chelonae TaxID=1774 RepID=UPI0018B03E82|nr:YbaB/EbfC family nucleoid-associated protein [Mycobacteroides chelonae]MBF9328422.1 YbaB/EbfC family nucleoid-associated protein [Mycobacteroides chelonae]MBF9422600.1 YbaB/EbfC family nucleoid-associated protein [Mycobacteroides chelonae]
MDFDSAVDLDAAQRVGNWLADAIGKIEGTAKVGGHAVPGGVGKVTVSAQGRLLRLELTPQSAPPRADRLAAWIEQAYVQACEAAVVQVREQIKKVTDANPQLADMFDLLDRDFGKLSGALRAPKPRAVREREQQAPPGDWDEEEWNPGADPFGRNRTR